MVLSELCITVFAVERMSSSLHSVVLFRKGMELELFLFATSLISLCAMCFEMKEYIGLTFSIQLDVVALIWTLLLYADKDWSCHAFSVHGV